MSALTTRPHRHRRPAAEIAGTREAMAIAAMLGSQVQRARRDAAMTQLELGGKVGLSQARISEIERGLGSGASLAAWIAVGIAVGRPLGVALSRPATQRPADAGHLSAQELILRLAKDHGIHGTFELPTRSASPATWVDVGLRDDARRVLSIIEVGNRVDDLGAARRAFKRHLADAAALAAAVGGDRDPYRVAGCWVLRATAANRDLVARYPAIFEADFPGSSRAWVQSLTKGAAAPAEPGIVWVDLAGTRISEVRRNDAGRPPRASPAATPSASTAAPTATASTPGATPSASTAAPTASAATPAPTSR